MLVCTSTDSIAGCLPPPLRLVSFNAKNIDNEIFLEWRTVGENNTDHFNIEQSIDGISFTKVGSLKAAGIDPLKRYYSFSDPKPKDGGSYYRLAMYDLDGTVTYSATQLIKTPATKRLKILPNPVPHDSKFSISWNGLAAANASILIYELNGRQVYKGKMGQSGKSEVSVSNWPAGLYNITIDNGIHKQASILMVKN